MLFATQFVRARRAGVANTPIARLAAKGLPDAPVNLSTYCQVDVERD
jgi:hypothetical protein